LYREVVEALADLRVRALLTVGAAGDPTSLEPLPRNVHVERWWPQAAVMPHAAAMIGHGGFGTVLHGLASGVPMVLLPLFADQRFNAARVEAMGAGLALEGGPAGVPGLSAALMRVLDDPSFQTHATSLADEISQLPPTAESVNLVEAVAAGTHP